MILLDTNVVSEAMRPAPASDVLEWLDKQSVTGLFTTAITEAELRFGLARMDAGRRRDGLAAALDRALETLFRGRVLPFDRDAARAYSEIAVHRFAIGRPISQLDCQIAAIARARGGAVATRNVTDFADTGVEIIDPWSAGGP